MTIGYNRLGSNGRFANQMFQYAGLRGVAANMGFDFKVPPPGNYGRSDYALFECFEMGTVKPENFGFVEEIVFKQDSFISIKSSLITAQTMLIFMITFRQRNILKT